MLFFNAFRDKIINWLNALEVYPMMVPLLAVREYRVDLLTGIVVSVGGLTESLVSLLLDLPVSRNVGPFVQHDPD